MESLSELVSGLRISNGKVEGAEALLQVWMLRNQDPEKAKLWENEFIDLIVQNSLDNKPSGLNIFVLAERRYKDYV